jgi:hypothetical protein
MLKQLSLTLVLAYASTLGLTVAVFDRSLISEPGFEKVQRGGFVGCPKGTRWNQSNRRCEKD